MTLAAQRPALGGEPSFWVTPRWQRRRAWLRAFRKAVASHAMELSRLVAEEVGKPEGEAYVTELLPLIAAIRWHERNAWRLLRTRPASGGPWWLPGRRIRCGRAPLGRVLIVATWNYPVGLLGVQLVQALAAGNHVTVKPSERTPESQRRLVGLAAACGAADWVELADAARSEGERLVRSGGFQKVIFTGGTGTGRRVASDLAERLTPSALELSGSDSALVLADADPDLAARRIWMAVTMNAGQTCMAPRRALVDRAVYRRFLDALSPMVAGAGPVRMVDSAEAARCVALAQSAMRQGGRSLSGVAEAASDGWLRPLAVVDCPAGAELVQGQHFGPVLAVVPVDGLKEALRVHQGVRRHLSVSVYTRSARRWSRDAEAVAALGASVVTFNESVAPTGHPAMSIAGAGESGWGATRGEAGLAELTRPVSVAETAGWIPDATPPVGEQLDWVDRLTRWINGCFGGRAVAPRSRTTASHLRPDARAAEGRRQHG